MSSLVTCKNHAIYNKNNNINVLKIHPEIERSYAKEIWANQIANFNKISLNQAIRLL